MVRFGLVLTAVLIFGSGPGAAQPMPPLPPPRPSDAPSPAPPPAIKSEPPQRSPQDGAQTVTEPDPCLTQLKAAGFDVEVAEQPSTENELCRIDMPVRLKAVPVRSRPGSLVRFGAQPILACRFADRFGHWVGDLVAPVLAGSLNTELQSIQTGPGFECRNRNGAATGKLSAHAEGLAIDIASFELANGSILRIKPEAGGPPDPALAAL